MKKRIIESKKQALFLIRLVVLTAFILAVFTSCDMRRSDDMPDTEYRSGSEGIVVRFMDGSPPRKVYEKTPLYIIVEVMNKGAFDNNPNTLGHVTLHGFDSTAMPFKDGNGNIVKKDLPAVLGKGPFLKEGGYDTITFEIDEGQMLVPYGDSYAPTLMLSACYYYRTIATPTVCIVSDPSLLVKNKVCEPRTITMKSQGAPVAVTKVEQEIMYKIVNFVITIENIGTGTVVKPSSFDDCPLKLNSHDKINIVKVTPTLRNAQSMGCSPGDEVRLVDGKGTIFCKFALLEGAPYTTPLKIQLDYAYNTNTQRSIEITKIPGTTYMGDPIVEDKLYSSTVKKEESEENGGE